MYKHLPKLLWTLAFVLGLFFMVYGFTKKTETTQKDADCSEKCPTSKMEAGLNIKNLTHHLLDFNK